MTHPVRIVDTDVHNSYRHVNDLLPYLPEPHRSRVADGGLGYPGSGSYSVVGVLRRDAAPSAGGPAGSDLGTLRSQLLDAYGIDYAILVGGGILGISNLVDPDYAAALATAHNDWMIEHWLARDPRLRGAAVVSTLDPELAAREIDRVGPHPGIVEVVMGSGQRFPLGQRYFHPIYAAAERQGLPVAIHPGTEGAGIANPPTSAGYPTSYIQWHTCLSQNFAAHTVSLVCDGVFQKFPRLKFVLIEGGVSWLAPLMWRLDKNYKALRSEVPWLTRLPSEYIKEHVRLTTQPIEEPADPRDLLRIFEIIDAERTLMYSSDYPHWDFDHPHTAFPRGMSETLRRRIMVENATELYGLPATAPDLGLGSEAATSGRADGAAVGAGSSVPVGE
jgi:predicted TIM-barrel fold metal-dependent hydrolase